MIKSNSPEEAKAFDQVEETARVLKSLGITDEAGDLRRVPCEVDPQTQEFIERTHARVKALEESTPPLHDLMHEWETTVIQRWRRELFEGGLDRAMARNLSNRLLWRLFALTICERLEELGIWDAAGGA